MAELDSHRMNRYFEKAKASPLNISFDETEAAFKSALSSNQRKHGQPSGFFATIRDFFKPTINKVYLFISLVLLAILIWSYFTQPIHHSDIQDIDHQEKKKQVGVEQQDHAALTETEEPVSSQDQAPERGAQKRETTSDIPLKEPSTPQSEETEEPLLVVPETNEEGFDEGKEEEEMPEIPERDIPSSKNDDRKKPVKDALRPPFEYTFTPDTPEDELRKLQSDLKKQGVRLQFTKLKYKKDRIDIVEGTIALEGYEGTFTTNDFTSFTLKWDYTHRKRGQPDHFDIVIDTPMEKKSNTSVNIDEIEY